MNLTADGWFIAELIVEITVEDDPRNVVHKNLVLISANSPEDAYSKAVELGMASECSYPNPSGKHVALRFRGISLLNLIYESLADGAELLYEERIAVSQDEIQKMLRDKEQLAVFRANDERHVASEAPDYSAADVMKDVEKLLGRE